MRRFWDMPAYLPSASRSSLIIECMGSFSDEIGHRTVRDLFPPIQSKYASAQPSTLVIPDYAKLRYIVRAPTWKEVKTLRQRVIACFECDRPLLPLRVDVHSHAA